MGAGAESAGAAAVTRYRDAVLATTGLVSYWRLQEPSGTTAADAKGTNTGTYVGTPTLGGASPISDTGAKSIALNGTTQYVSAADAASLRFTSTLSLEAWINPTDRAGNYPIFGKWASNLGYIIWLDSGTGNVLWLRDAGSDSMATVIPTGSWSHVVFTLGGGVADLYVNNTNVHSGAATAASSTTNEFRIGSYVGSATPFKGSVAEPAAYSTKITATDVSNHWGAR